MVLTDLKTKQCLFCAETIRAAAIKCRFCGEFLNSPKAKALEADLEQEPDSELLDDEETEEEEMDDNVLFVVRPSLWGITSSLVKGLFFFVLAGLLIKLPLENTVNNLLGLELTENQILTAGMYRVLAGYGLGVVVVLVLLLKIVRLKMTYYEVTPDRIEWGRGILDRRVDNIDMFRVIDLRMRRSILDCIVGIGTVGLITTDKTNPEFEFEKIRRPRELYDIIKRASLEADRRTGVVHLE
ncbi:MAG: PH domain-containing protein [Planctomycetes bacterium]|nr:PH domain-containing protein [Planctomycetota bacterium]MCH8120403.1 PH domain-containing protein [Planctomycetota bacterium]